MQPIETQRERIFRTHTQGLQGVGQCSPLKHNNVVALADKDNRLQGVGQCSPLKQILPLR